LKIDSYISSGSSAEIEIGNSLALADIPLGLDVP